MNELLSMAATAAASHRIIWFVIMLICADTFFGCLRALKQKKFNSCVGIDGAIRKVAMIGSLLFLVIADRAVQFNFVAFVPQEILSAAGITMVGATEFFGLLFVCYELISILKNMTLCGLPTERVEKAFRQFLSKFTDELPDME